MKVLLGWELGAGQGHIQRLVALARKLEARGFVPIFALRDYTLRGVEFSWQGLMAPRLPFLGRENSYTFADILATFGFAQPELLHQHLQSWQGILKAHNPQLVVADHAPGLVLAARGLVPTAVIGSHFAVPPAVEVFPAFRANVPPESAESQRQVSAAVRQVVPLDRSLGEALNGDRSFIFSIPELDCYAGVRPLMATTHYVSAHIAPLVRSNGVASSSPWSYLAKDYPAYDLILSTFNLQPQFQPLQEALLDKSIAVHHGGLTTTIACLLAGVPQLILPRYVEQQLNGFAIARLGVGHVLTTLSPQHLVSAQSQVQGLSANAQLKAEEFASWNQSFLDSVVESCVQLAM